jgi:hypothetical protein
MSVSVGARTKLKSSLVRRDGSDRGCELRMHIRINRPVLDFRTGFVFAKVVVAVPILGWPDRSRHEAAATIRANIIQDVVDTRTTERTFIAAYARLQRIER